MKQDFPQAMPYAFVSHTNIAANISLVVCFGNPQPPGCSRFHPTRSRELAVSCPWTNHSLVPKAANFGLPPCIDHQHTDKTVGAIPCTVKALVMARRIHLGFSFLCRRPITLKLELGRFNASEDGVAHGRLWPAFCAIFMIKFETSTDEASRFQLGDLDAIPELLNIPLRKRIGAMIYTC